jgi:hypothetical protein
MLLRKMLMVLGIGVAHAHVQMVKSIRSVIRGISVTLWHALRGKPVHATNTTVRGVTGKLHVQHQHQQHALHTVLTVVCFVTVDITRLATLVLKTFVIAPMVMQPRAKHVLHMMLIFVRLVPVDITKMQRNVSKTFVIAPMAMKQRAHVVLPMVRIFVSLVPMDITKMATHARRALRVVRTNTSQEHCALVLETVIPKRVRCALLVALEKVKRLLVLRHRIVFVLKTFVLVPTALQQWAQIVLPMMLIFVRLVPVDITKLATMLVLHVPVDNIKLSVDNPRVKPVPVDNTKNKVGNPLAKHVPVVLTVM